MCVYVYVCICICMCVYIYIYMNNHLLQKEIPRYRRESITVEGNPLLGTKPLSLVV